MCIYIDTRDKCLRMLLVCIQIKPKTASYYCKHICFNQEGALTMVFDSANAKTLFLKLKANSYIFFRTDTISLEV
jgi:hypothetical protein